MYYKKLDLPVIPNNLLNEEFIPEMGTNDIGYGAEHFKHGIKLEPCSYWFSSVKNKELISWLQENVPAFKPLSNILYQQTYHKTGGYHIVHSDIRRSFALNYMIELGGDNVLTTWYREKGKPLKRFKTVSGRQSDVGYIDYANLEILESVKFEKNKWYIISTNILHDAGEIKGLRKSITISIPFYLEKKILEILNV